MSTARPTDGHPRRHTWLGGALVAVILVAAVVTTLLVRSETPSPPGDASPPAPDTSTEPDGSASEAAPQMPSPVERPTWTSLDPYSDDSPWNTPIGDDAPIHARSSALVARIGGELTSDTSQYTLPVYEVDGDTPTVSVKVLHLFSEVTDHGTTVERRQEPVIDVPVPDGAEAATGTDAQVVIVDTTTGDEWGFWHLEATEDGFQATNGYRYHVGWNGVPPDGFGSRGAGVPYLAGLIRPAAIERGRIDHAIAFAYPTPSPNHVFPATKSDGPGDPELDLPEGARLRLDPSLDEDDLRAIGLDDTGRVIARALQEYGMILVDIAGRPKIYAEYHATAEWGDNLSEEVISALPIERFEVLDWESMSQPPLAQPTAPTRVPSGSDLVLDGRHSTGVSGTIDAFEWTDNEGRVVGEEAVVRYPTTDLEPGWHRFTLRVGRDDAVWSEPRDLLVEVVEVDRTFITATTEIAGSAVRQLELPGIGSPANAAAVVAVALRRLNEDDDVGVDHISGGGGSWERVVREVDDRGTIALEIWSNEAPDAADSDLTVTLTSETNAAAQLLGLAQVGTLARVVSEQTGSETTAEASVRAQADAGGFVLGLHAGRTEDYIHDGDGAVIVANTVVDAGGGSVRLSSVGVHPDRDGPVEVSGSTRSPMEWTMAALSFAAPDGD